MAPLLLAANCGLSPQAHAQLSTNGAPVSVPETSSFQPQPWMGPAGFRYILDAVAPPPEPGSADEKSDLDQLLQAQAARTPADIKEAMADEHFSLKLLAEAVGPDCTPKKFPVAFALLEKVLREEEFFNGVLKAKYKRARPYADHPEIKNLYSAATPSYPSDRASASRLSTLLLMELFPAKSGAVLDRDLVLGQSGVNAGVDYPSDVIQGRNLAHAILYVIHDTPSFQQELMRAKRETGSASVPTLKSAPF